MSRIVDLNGINGLSINIQNTDPDSDMSLVPMMENSWVFTDVKTPPFCPREYQHLWNN